MSTQTNIEVFFGKFSLYIVAFFGALSIILGTGWYVSNIQLENQTAKTEAIKTQLEVSNASYKSIKDQFGLLTNQLEKNQEKALESHAILQDRLKQILETDKSRQTLETYLLSRPPETDCKTPKDLADAWSKM